MQGVDIGVRDLSRRNHNRLCMVFFIKSPITGDTHIRVHKDMLRLVRACRQFVIDQMRDSSVSRGQAATK